jgi:hypothetical protein
MIIVDLDTNAPINIETINDWFVEPFTVPFGFLWIKDADTLSVHMFDKSATWVKCESDTEVLHPTMDLHSLDYCLFDNGNGAKPSLRRLGWARSGYRCEWGTDQDPGATICRMRSRLNSRAARHVTD